MPKRTTTKDTTSTETTINHGVEFHPVPSHRPNFEDQARLQALDLAIKTKGDTNSLALAQRYYTWLVHGEA